MTTEPRRPGPVGRACSAGRARSASGVALALFVGVASLLACPADPRDALPPPVARVGNQTIEEGRLLAVLAQRGVARVPDDEARLQIAARILEEVVDEELLLQAATRAGIEVGDEAVAREVRARAEGYPSGAFQRMLTAEQLTIDAFHEGVRRRLVQDAFLRARLADLPRLTEEEVRARFEALQQPGPPPEKIRVRQVLLRTSEEAGHVLEQVRARRLSVEQAAQKYSIGPEAEQGGDLGWFAEGELPSVFDLAFLLQKGQVSDVVGSDYGFHIFQLVDRRAPQSDPFDARRAQIEEDLVRERQTQAVQALLLGLKRELVVTIDPGALARVVQLLPPAPHTPAEGMEQASGRALDSHVHGSDPLPPVPKY